MYCFYINDTNNDTNNYEQLEFDPTELHTGKIKSEINNLKNENLLTSKTEKSLLEEKIQTLEFHFLPKINKANIPGRPIISCVNCHTGRISEFLDYYLQPEVKKLNSMLKTLRMLLRKLKS